MAALSIARSGFPLPTSLRTGAHMVVVTTMAVAIIMVAAGAKVASFMPRALISTSAVPPLVITITMAADRRSDGAMEEPGAAKFEGGDG